MQNLNKIFPTVIIIFLIFAGFFAYTKLVFPLPFSINNVSTIKNEAFSVTGEGKVVVKPDIAYVNIGIQAKSNSVKSVQNQINSTINQVSSSLKRLGIDEKDIKTLNYNINPIYDWTSGHQYLSGYNANTTLEVKVRNLDKINEVIDQSTASGANEISNINFEVEDKTAAEEEARKDAVAEAKKKAQDAARVAGFKLGKIINYSESTGPTPRPVAYDLKASSPVSMGGGTEIQTGSSEITLTVTLTYQIE